MPVWGICVPGFHRCWDEVSSCTGSGWTIPRTGGWRCLGVGGMPGVFLILNSPALFRKPLCFDLASCDHWQNESKAGVQLARTVSGKMTILQSYRCLQRRKCHNFTKLSCKLQSHFSAKKGSISKTAKNRSLAFYTWVAQPPLSFSW